MLFGLLNNWNSAAKKLQNNTMTVQQFVNAQEKKTLFYSTPFVDGEDGAEPNVLQKQDSDVEWFPVFTSAEGLQRYMTTIGGKPHMVIKGDLKTVLMSLDSHPVLKEWGVVVDPQSAMAVEIPPQVRVQPKCLR